MWFFIYSPFKFTTTGNIIVNLSELSVWYLYIDVNIHLMYYIISSALHDVVYRFSMDLWVVIVSLIIILYLKNHSNKMDRSSRYFY